MSSFEPGALYQNTKYSSGAPETTRLVVIRNDTAYCGHCSRSVGNLDGRNLLVGEAILISRTKFRCRSCREKNIFFPRGALDTGA